MNINKVNNVLSNMSFQSNSITDKQAKRKSQYLPIKTLVLTGMLMGVAGCNNDTFSKEHLDATENRSTYSIHRPQNIRLNHAERILERKAQKLAGDYYEVEYLPDKQMFKLTADDICLNPLDRNLGFFPDTTGQLKIKFALRNGAILEHNPELKQVLNQDGIWGTTIDESIENAMKKNRTFFTVITDPDNAIDEAILLPGESLFIPLKEIGKSPRMLRFQIPSDFKVFTDAAKK